ncbi:tripartite motif-containing protein 3-like [Lingula anatina]|uniref:Tripartite motif-containing protein 3-like n=1 Tax=Lingula anatina TaxID=7574 RepID=A0A1S3JSZ5_LINAN|nr:tripartite motif-containing protein 3-like [Lingula anatina]|eukprot:XP_013413159.1 tripartite motif-containing protein 3-like [Lingula anatina]
MAEALVAAFTDNLLTCSICLGEYEDPRVLPCHHTFCYGCISNHATGAVTRGKTFPCPLCRKTTKFPKEGLMKLKKDFRVQKAKELLSQQHEVSRSSIMKEPDEHGVAHGIQEMMIKCEKHPTNELKYYCEDDDSTVCGDCAIAEHYRHGIVTVEKAAISKRKKIKTALEKTLSKQDTFKAAAIKITASELQDFHIREASINNIKKQAQHIRRLVDQKEQTLISEVNSAYDIRKKQKKANKDILENHCASLQSAYNFAQELITNGSDSDIMIQTKALTERLTAIEKMPFPTLDTPVQVSYCPGNISTVGLEAMLGQVAVQLELPLAGLETNPKTVTQPPVFLEKAECVHSFSAKQKDDTRNMSITGLAVDEQHVFIVDRMKRNNRTVVFTHEGQFKFDIKLQSPFDVAVSQAGHLYVTSQGDKCVKVYSTRGQQLTTMGLGQLELPHGITLGTKGQVIICDNPLIETKSLFTFHADSGLLLNTIPLTMCADSQYIAVNKVNDNIVISDLDNNCVHVLTPSGDQLYQYGTQGSGDGQLWCPYGVCTDSHGHIFIADWGNHRIVALSPQGQFIRYLATKDDGLKYPAALAINPAGQLVVAEEKGMVKTFQYL